MPMRLTLPTLLLALGMATPAPAGNHLAEYCIIMSETAADFQTGHQRTDDPNKMLALILRVLDEHRAAKPESKTDFDEMERILMLAWQEIRMTTRVNQDMIISTFADEVRRDCLRKGEVPPRG